MKKTLMIMLAMVIGMTAIAYTVDARQAKAAQEQTYTVTGRVTDMRGDDVIGATVLIEGTKVGTQTNDEGKYLIGGVKKGDKLVFSYTGLWTESVVFQGQQVINVTLREDGI